MNIYRFNRVLFKGDLNNKFFLFCLSKDFKLLKYLFINLYNFFLSLFIKSKKDLYKKNKYKYLKDIDNLDKVKKEFYKKKRYKNIIELKDGFIIDNIPIILLEKKYQNNAICYEFNKDYEVKLDEFNKRVKSIKKCENLYIRNYFDLKHIVCEKNYIFFNNLVLFIKKRIFPSQKIIIPVFILIGAFIITCMSFCYTFSVIDLKYIKTYFEIRLFLLNFLPIVILMLIGLLLTKKLSFSYFVTSFLILILGVANQNKIFYRDDIVKFEDIVLIKEALIISKEQSYDFIIRWYTVFFAIFIIVLTILIKRFVPKIKLKLRNRLVFLVLLILISIFGYNHVYKNTQIYDNVGSTYLINQYIGTRNYQIRGLIYPFIYTLEDGFNLPPDGYDEKEVQKILSEYKYNDIPQDKKPHIIAIMLEAYNDFSKFEQIKFDEDIYKKFHEIQKKSISGNLITTIFGGGTIITERDFLTGYNSYPSFGKKTNSYVWYLKEQGYKTEAMHPIYGAFYNRQSVNINLGFDKYYYYENTFSKISDEWLMDNELYPSIIEGYNRALDENVPYFNFTVTYQNHGPYNSENYDGKKFYFKNFGLNDATYNLVNQYFDNIKKVNDALYDLIEYFDKADEPVIVIVFGDHNPYLGETGYQELNIDIDLSSLSGYQNYYEIPYIIHANKSAKKMFDKSFVGKGNTISPIFLMNEFFDYVGLSTNEYMQYTSNFKKEIDVISDYYCKANEIFVNRNEEICDDRIKEFNNVNYYVGNNFKMR